MLPLRTACEYGPIACGASLVAMKSIPIPFSVRRDSIIAELMPVYPGNSALSTAVKDRVLSTFQQTVTLFKQGRTEEVVQGCGLILRMDPLFDPAKKLMEKARNPSAPINVDSLIASDPIAEARTAMQAR